MAKRRRIVFRVRAQHNLTCSHESTFLCTTHFVHRVILNIREVKMLNKDMQNGTETKIWKGNGQSVTFMCCVAVVHYNSLVQHNVGAVLFVVCSDLTAESAARNPRNLDFL